MKKYISIAIFALLLFGFGKSVAARATTTDDTLWVIYANQCKSVNYTVWSPCIQGFNVQIRSIIKPENGCTPTSAQQVEQIRFCDSHDYFGYSIR